jgi:hypothetical protein
MNISDSWTIDDDDLKRIDEQIAAEETAHEILCDALIAQGWILIKYPTSMRDMLCKPNKRDWCTEVCSGRWEMTNAGYFIFESEKDAAWFALRWS